MKKLSIAAVAVCLLGAGASAQAAGKKRVVVERFTAPYEFTIDCSDFGPYDFENLVSGEQRVTITDVVGDDGTLLQTVFHVVFSETGTNSQSGATLPLKGAAHEVWEYAENTRTVSGKVYLGTERGSGTYLQDTGRITMTLDERRALFVAGPHEGFFGGVDTAVCAALDDA